MPKPGESFAGAGLKPKEPPQIGDLNSANQQQIENQYTPSSTSRTRMGSG
jgi:hypothetical protein